MSDNISKVVDELVNKRAGISIEGPAEEEVDLREIEEEVQSHSRIRSTRQNRPARNDQYEDSDGLPDLRRPNQYGYRATTRWGGYGRKPLQEGDIDWQRLSRAPAQWMFWMEWVSYMGLPYPLYLSWDTEVYDRINDAYHSSMFAAFPDEYKVRFGREAPM